MYVFYWQSMKLGIVYNPWALYTMPKTLGKALKKLIFSRHFM